MDAPFDPKHLAEALPDADASGTEEGIGPVPQITFLVNAHREAELLHIALRSALEAKAVCADSGVSTEILVIGDCADDPTRKILETWRDRIDRLEFVEFGCLGQARTAGIERAAGTFTAFLDGDDLWQPEWPLYAYRCAQAHDAARCIFHTEVFAAFADEVFLRHQLSTDDPLFHPAHLAISWQFCNNLFARTELLRQIPIHQNDLTNGFGSEDWHWSCETLHAGIARIPVPKTVYLYRREQKRVTLGRTQGIAIRPSDLFRRDPRIASFAREYTAEAGSVALLTDLESAERSCRAPDWLRRSIERLCHLEPKIWTLMRSLEEELLRTPRMYTSAAIVLSEIRRLWDEAGAFGIVLLANRTLGTAESGALVQAIKRTSRDIPLVVALDTAEGFHSPITRSGNVLYLDLPRLLEINANDCFPLVRLFITAIVQFQPRFLLNVGHWFGESLIDFRNLLSCVGLRYAYLGTIRGSDGGPAPIAATCARMQNGSAWYNEIWLAGQPGDHLRLPFLAGHQQVRIQIMENASLDQLFLSAVRGQAAADSRLPSTVPGPLLKTATPPQVSCLINAHRERDIIVPTLASVQRMRTLAEAQGVTSELVIVCDKSDSLTKNIIRNFFRTTTTTMIDVEFGDLGLARNVGITESKGEYVALLDGDDLYSRNWLVAAHGLLSKAGNSLSAAHPALNIYFGRETRYFWHQEWDPDSPEKRSLLFDNWWTSLSFCRRDTYLHLPFRPSDLEAGIGFEDWRWNIDLIEAGGTHIIAPGTSHFVRLKETGSLNSESAGHRCVVGSTRFLRDLVISR